MNKTGTKPALHRRLELESRLDGIHLVEGIVDDIKSELDFKEDVYGNVMVAVTEAVNNSIVHGNKNETSKKVIIELEMKNPYCLMVSVQDEGKGFDPNMLPDPTSPDNIENIGGRGVFLMRQLADEISFHDDGRRVEMIFNI